MLSQPQVLRQSFHTHSENWKNENRQILRDVNNFRQIKIVVFQ